GTLIAYATAPGRVAKDGDGPNGLYTNELLKAIKSPGLKIEDVFKRVRQAVSSQTHGAQIPWEASSLIGDFAFVSSPSSARGRPQASEGDEPKPPTGSLVIASRTEGAEVSVGGRVVGIIQSGANIVVEELQPGSHHIVARKDGFEPWEGDAQI